MPNRIGYARALNRDKWRDNISIAKILSTLEKVEQEVSANWRQLTSEQTAALRLLTDIQFRKLAKVMPDVKAVELRAEVGQPQPWNPLQITAANLERLSATLTFGTPPAAQERMAGADAKAESPAEPPKARLLR